VKNSRFLRFTKYALILGVAVFVMGLTPAHADTIYNVTGTFSNGSALTGTVNIDATGAVTGGSFTLGTGTGVSSPISFTALIAGSMMQLDPGVFAATFATAGNPSGNPFITIVFSSGVLCVGSAGCAGEITQFSLNGEDFTDLTSSTASIANAPEPATYLMLFSGLVGLGLLSRKRLVETTNA
jgi:hypothetical protein